MEKEENSNTEVENSEEKKSQNIETASVSKDLKKKKRNHLNMVVIVLLKKH